MKAVVRKIILNDFVMLMGAHKPHIFEIDPIWQQHLCSWMY